ncbi:MAG: P-loop NTPase [Candidatus Bathyarchaeota archaeon]|nr:P-loop NTPase [Candidatus Termiticorpusculum sp.]
MKILICGKGGSGKSTVTTLLANNLQTKGYRIIVVDTDESNYGLNTQLGINAPKELMDQIGGKKAIIDKMLVAREKGEKVPIFTEKWCIDDIPSDYIAKKNNIYLLQIGKVKHFGEGCACPIGGLSRDFLKNLQLNTKDIALIDTEAGVEHLGRGIAGNVDVVLVILDPSYESIQLSQKITSMAKEGNKPVYFILNKTDNTIAHKIADKMDKQQIIGTIPFNPVIQEKGLNGEPLNIESHPVTHIADFLIQTLSGA